MIITWEDLNLDSRVNKRFCLVDVGVVEGQALCVAFSNQGRIFQGFPEPIIRKIAEHLLQATYTCGLDAHCDLSFGACCLMIMLTSWDLEGCFDDNDNSK